MLDKLLGRVGLRPRRLQLRHFEDVLQVEFTEIDARRSQRHVGMRQSAIQLIPGDSPLPNDGRTSDLVKLVSRVPATKIPQINPINPQAAKMRPRPVPCDATGLAFSGGGIRSAAVCLGAMQALRQTPVLGSIDYLSTVSGGGYIGSCLSVAMSQPKPEFPFGDDIADSPAIAHIRNYSNYLLPRDHSAVANLSGAGVVILRGLLANLLVALLVILAMVVITQIAYPDAASLSHGSFLPRLFGEPGGVLAIPFGLPLLLAGLLALELVAWIVLRLRSKWDTKAGDTRGVMLKLAQILAVVSVVMVILDAQPLAIRYFHGIMQDVSGYFVDIKTLAAALTALAAAIAAFSDTLGRFLKLTERSAGLTMILRRVAAKAALVFAAIALPFVLWLVYLDLSVAAVYRFAVPSWLDWSFIRTLIWYPIPFIHSKAAALDLFFAVVIFVVALFFRANAYSLHRLYRDRLSRAFIFKPTSSFSDPDFRDPIKLSQLRGGAGPYHILNAALNVQGSTQANKRGRGADFFIFTQDFVGSDLTMFGPTSESNKAADVFDMESKYPKLDLATAMAISGAAVSANMGSNTIRLLSPTLALLNVRLGYWLRNPRDLALQGWARWKSKYIGGPLTKFYLLGEMFNQLDETSRHIYLSDGGHIENLGVYELLKRGCRAIVVIDAEADPEMSFSSLLKLERYARIDLGVRIILPWEAIAKMTKEVSDEITGKRFPDCKKGPHCALGRIIYENGVQGVILYFKSSLTGDEKDYILDYKKRNADFPHETTGDQFFSEEQFEAYRALGFHMVEGVFRGNNPDDVSFLLDGANGWPDQATALKEANRHLVG